MPKRSPSAQARRNRQRGSEGERELATLLSDALGIVVQRRLGQERDSGGDLHVGHYSVECKRRKRLGQFYAWWAQAEKAAVKADKIPLLAFRADGKDWIVAFRLPDAINLLRESLPARGAPPVKRPEGWEDDPLTVPWEDD